MLFKIKVNRSILIIGMMMILSGLVGLDQYYRHTIRTLIDTIIFSHKDMLENNNYYEFDNAFDQIKKINPSIGASAIYAQGHKKSGESSFSLVFDYHHAPQPKTALITATALFSYRVDYVFQNQDYVLSFYFQDRDRAQMMLYLMLGLFFFLGMNVVLQQVLDIDRTRQNTLDFAISQTAKAIHFVKTHLHSAEELHKWMSHHVSMDVSIEKNIKYILKRFSHSKIEMDGLNSVLRLNKYSGPSEQIDIRTMVEMLVQCYADERIQIQTFFDKDLPLVSLDRDVFIATVGNLIKNAYDYSDQFVWIRCKVEKNNFVISVSNTGRHMSQSEVKKILFHGESFSGSSGLGLTICQAWVQRIGAHLEITSTRGCNTFEIYFPLKLFKKASSEKINHVSQLEDSPSIEDEKTNLSVLVLEDASSFRHSLLRDLHALGLNVKDFENPESFFDFLSEHAKSFDFIITDRHMRGFDAVRDRFPDSCRYYGFKGKIILFTADPSSIDGESYGAPFDAIVRKGEEVDWKGVLKCGATVK